MKKTLALVLISATILIFSCKKKEDDASKTSSTTPSYVNQVLQGKIAGVNWTFAAGNVTSGKSFFDTTNNVLHTFTTSDSIPADSCFINSFGKSKIIFSIADKNKLLTTGTRKLKFGSFTSSDNMTVTFVSYENGTSFNNIATTGAYEILTVDTTKKMVTGRMDVEIDKNNFMNGNFSMKYCSWEK